MTIFIEKLKFVFKKYENIFYPLISFGLFIAIWAIYSASVKIELILPSPAATFNSFFALLGLKTFWIAVGNTLLRTTISFIISFFLATFFAIIGAFCRPVHKLLEPIITILRATPTMSIILLAIIWLKSTTSPMLIAFLVVFPMCYTAIYEAIINVDGKLLEMSNVYRVKKIDIVKKFYIPSISPTLFSSAKSNISLNVKIIIAAEVLAQTRDSIGNYMQLSKIYLDTSELLAWSITAVLLSYLLEGVVKFIKFMAVRWENEY
ncbi:MAG: ABC transporter permease subunit [Clostridia bacterium]